jgi:pilus assembly protein CpaB
MKKALPLIVALVLGVLAVLGVQHYLSQKDIEFRKKTRPMKVIVVGDKIAAGQKLVRSVLQEREFPEAMLPENVVTAQDLKDILNQPVNRNIYPGEPLLWSYLGREEKKQSLSEVIPLDERAITIASENIAGVDGYIQPNDRVDIYIIVDVPTKKKQKVPTKEGDLVDIEVDDTKNAAFLLLQNVTVLATGSSFARGVVDTQQDYGAITLSVTPSEAGLLKFASETGRLSLTLRNPQDFGETSKIEIFDMDSILDVAKLRELQNARKKRIEVYRKGKALSVER